MTQLGCSVDLLEGRKALQRDLDRLDPRTKANWMRFNKGQDPALVSQQSRAALYTGAEWMESGPVEKDLGMLVGIWLIVIQLCAQEAKKATAAWFSAIVQPTGPGQ
ncbi:hypothetical protein DUI87_22292 [Hirundo rustica rustica]|uniref:Uncharacterized protein n=1 Tax=Hirundo rustica rustica TaxID=333673 RepID=A0A3M0JR23_HIRRU|nr:hypothetical protein DUI87_22292 [Hirundo rustica rustica]